MVVNDKDWPRGTESEPGAPDNNIEYLNGCAEGAATATRHYMDLYEKVEDIEHEIELITYDIQFLKLWNGVLLATALATACGGLVWFFLGSAA